jgi:hypothetical protein
MSDYETNLFRKINTFFIIFFFLNSHTFLVYYQRQASTLSRWIFSVDLLFYCCWLVIMMVNIWLIMNDSVSYSFSFGLLNPYRTIEISSCRVMIAFTWLLWTIFYYRIIAYNYYVSTNAFVVYYKNICQTLKFIGIILSLLWIALGDSSLSFYWIFYLPITIHSLYQLVNTSSTSYTELVFLTFIYIHWIIFNICYFSISIDSFDLDKVDSIYSFSILFISLFTLYHLIWRSKTISNLSF